MARANDWTRWVKQFRESGKCVYPLVEGPHKVACRDSATGLSSDGYPTCPEHTDEPLRKEWKGFIKVRESLPQHLPGRPEITCQDGYLSSNASNSSNSRPTLLSTSCFLSINIPSINSC